MPKLEKSVKQTSKKPADTWVVLWDELPSAHQLKNYLINIS